MRYHVKMARCEIRVGNQRVYYQVVGEGEPVILVHGLSASSRWWVRNVAALAEHYRVYLVDLPGFGMMRGFFYRFVLDNVTTWLLAWMEVVGLKEAYFVGHSMGGYICIRVAAQRPEVVRRLILVSPAGLPGERTLAGYLVPLLRTIYYVTPSFLPILFYDALRAGPLTFFRAARDLLSKDMQDVLESVTVPTLLIWGENDTLVPAIFGDILRQKIARSRLLLLKKAGHVVMYDQPEEFNAGVLAFLDGESVGK
jgi:pimeloyl-ACP methyl ester carboxylesterase